MLLLFATALISLPWISDTGDVPAEPVARPQLVIGPISRLVRDFMRQGDAALSGQAKAIENRQALARRIAEIFAAEPAATWATEEGALELMRFVLLGGSPQVLKRAIEDGVLPRKFEQAANGLVAFSERRLDDARESLIEDAGEPLPVDIEDALALIKGALLSAKDPERAIGYLRRTQLAAPGTALEEAALRQYIIILFRQSRIDRGIEKLKVYVRRYPKSIYWSQFCSVAATVLAENTNFEPAEFSEMDDGAASSTSRDRLQEFSVFVGKQLVLYGSFDKASAVLKSVVGRLEPTSNLWRIAKRYLSLAEAVGSEPRVALKSLQGIDLIQLPADERALIRAGISIAHDVLTGYSGADEVTTRGRVSRSRSVEIESVQPLSLELHGRVKGAIELAQKMLDQVQP